MQVKDKLKNIAREKNVEFNILLKYYVFDRFIVRLSKSEYKDNFIIKGGFLLSQLFGIHNRSTTDIDYALQNQRLTKDNVLNMINNVISIDLDDNIKFSIKSIDSIREEDIYGGYRITLLFQLEGIRELLKLDIAIGDPITPNEIVFHYITMLDEEKVDIWSYNIETILAEKLESIFSKLESTSRMKDYYDIYLIYNRNWDNLNKQNFVAACSNTFKKREFNVNLFDSLEIICDSLVLRKRWADYCKKNSYSKEIEFDEIINCLEKIITFL